MMRIVIARNTRVALIHRMWRWWWWMWIGTLMGSLMVCLGRSLVMFGRLLVHIHVRQVPSRVVIIVHDTLTVLMHQMLIPRCIWSTMTTRMCTSLRSMSSLLWVVTWGKQS